jgi:hypothetical protein
MMRATAVLCALAALSAAPAYQSAEAYRKGEFEGREALLLANDRVELTMLARGGAFAHLVLRDDATRTNPLWEPIRMAREAGGRSSFGTAMGHFVCVDGFGPVSAEEKAAGLPGHGEAHTLPWEVTASEKAAGVATIRLTVRLPILQEVFTRTLRLADGENVLYVDSELENLVGFDRPVCWAEHATIGSPFLEPGKTVVDISARRAKTREHPPSQPLPLRLAPSVDFTWPIAPGIDGSRIDLRAPPPGPNSLDHTTSLMDPERSLEFVTALHPERRLLVGYMFKREEFPWLQTWEYYPPNLKMARGLEFGTMPFDVSRREAFDAHSLFGTPTYRWLPAKSKIRASFILFYAQVPEGMTRVDDVRLEGGALRIEDRGAGKQLRLPARLQW